MNAIGQTVRVVQHKVNQIIVREVAAAAALFKPGLRAVPLSVP
ncbi:MAG: hypothetical protein M5U12_21135 [Verrucomicrobia bacterium]|nr:hypothetical protein [Verrucomicrobiota bacterium]